MADATCIVKQRPFITAQIGINTLSPVFHRHGYMPLGTTFCKLQYSRNNSPHILQFHLLQIVLGNRHIRLYNLSVWRILPCGKPHVLLVSISSIRNQFCCRTPMRSSFLSST